MGVADGSRPFSLVGCHRCHSHATGEKRVFSRLRDHVWHVWHGSSRFLCRKAWLREWQFHARNVVTMVTMVTMVTRRCFCIIISLWHACGICGIEHFCNTVSDDGGDPRDPHPSRLSVPCLICHLLHRASYRRSSIMMRATSKSTCDASGCLIRAPLYCCFSRPFREATKRWRSATPSIMPRRIATTMFA